MNYQTQYVSPLGIITILTDDQAILGLWFENQKHFGAKYGLDQIPTVATPLHTQATAWLDRYFAGQHPDPRDLPLAPAGTPFQQQVFTILQTIPYGQTYTYQQIADRISATDHHTAPRAVGGAVGHNPISIIIPCHRVVGSDGNLTGYAGGIDRKIWLLHHESALLA